MSHYNKIFIGSVKSNIMDEQIYKDLPREYTIEEIRHLFLEAVSRKIEYWENESRKPASLDKLNSLAHSILALIDGEGDLPSMILAPNPNLQDKGDAIKMGQDYFPENFHADINGNISGNLCEEFEDYRVRE